MTGIPALTLRSITEDDMTAEKALKIGQAVGRSYKNVCVGSDANPSSGMIRNSLISGLLSSGADVKDAGIMPAPAVALTSKGSGCILMVGEPDKQGLISGVRIMNPDGSVFTKEQIRQIIKAGEADIMPPDYKGVGTVRACPSTADEYNSAISSKYGKSTDAIVMLDCGCGCTSACAPQILASIGADLTAINAQEDPGYSPRPPGVDVSDLSKLSEMIDPHLGGIGIALNGDGTKLALMDEGGKYVDPESVLALLLIYLKPSTLVVPFEASAVVDDAFRDLIGEGMKTGAKAHSERRIFRAGNDLESITASMIENNAEMGAMTDGTFIFSDVTMCPDAINAAAILTKISGENSISNLLASFPKYIVLKDSVHGPGNIDLFNKKLTEKLKELDAEEVWEIDGGRVGMSEGWFAISRNPEDTDYIDITAESRDKAYAVSMMELAKGIVHGCL
ncbi:MAG: hypothetical protein LBR42_02250 [Candidatus Methanoplasma sp.]|nr:hypothetical protein [Candidatus Methanoplasma sp.]